MKKMLQKIAGFLLMAVLICGLLPMTAEAAAPENSLILVVEAEGRLVIAPEYVTYVADMNIGQALAASDHVFEGLADGQVYAINGVAGSFTRSDQTGSHDLMKPASDVTHYRFSENVDSSQPSENLMALMTVMADYLLEEPDVQAAAKIAYDAAVSAFVGVSDEDAQTLAQGIRQQIEAYKSNLSKLHRVTFSGFTSASYPGIVVTAENEYGKIWTDDNGDGILQLPNGMYAFQISWQGMHITGPLTVENADQSMTAAFPDKEWLDTSTLQVSTTNDPAGSNSSQDVMFESGVLQLGSWTNRTTAATIKDAFSGKLYVHAKSTLNVVPQLYAVYQNAAGETVKQQLAHDSRRSGVSGVLQSGSLGNSLIIRVSQKDQQTQYEVSQDYTVNFSRIPTLKNIAVTNEKNVSQASTEPFSSETYTYTYPVLQEVKSVNLNLTPFAADYEIRIFKGKEPVEGTTVTLDEGAESTEIRVVVSSNGCSSAYALNVKPGTGYKATLKTKADSVRVVNNQGVELPMTMKKLQNDGTWNYYYTLVDGQTYYYEATQASYYHARDSFTFDAKLNQTIDIEVQTDNWLENLEFGFADYSKGSIQLDTQFQTDNHSYEIVVPDTNMQVWAWTKIAERQVYLGMTIQALYDGITDQELSNGAEKLVTLSPYEKGMQLQNLLMLNNPHGNTLTIRLSRTINDVLYYQDYQIKVKRTLTLQSLETFRGTERVSLLQAGTETSGFSPAVQSYTVDVPMAAASLDLKLSCYDNENNVRFGDETSGYQATVNDTVVTGMQTVRVPLNGTTENETVSIVVSNTHVPGETTTYTITVRKKAPVELVLNLEPGDALLCIHEISSKNRVWPEGNVLQISEGFQYRYSLTKNGYVGKSGTLKAERDENEVLYVWHGEEKLPLTDGNTLTLSMTLEAAAPNPAIDRNIVAQWKDFRGNENNSGVSDTKIPIAADDGTLYWSTKLGTGTGESAVGCPIIVDGDLITYASNTIYRVDAVTGEVLAKGTMDHSSSFAINTPTYAEGMIFIALSNGTVQAFNAETLESLWLYQDPLAGQPNCPIVVRDGYLYTGFWYSEVGDANFVCLSVTDENPNKTNETKPATWYHTQKGGFYWAGACVTDSYLLVGTDDGYSGYYHDTAQLLLLDPQTGAVLDTLDHLTGDIRSTIAYDETTEAYYFTAKGGYFHGVQVNSETRKFENHWEIPLENGGDATAMSTSTPVVYKGRAYVGVSGVGQFSAYSGHNITVVDLENHKIAYRVDTQGYPQTSGLLTTAYEEGTGYVYVYFFDNMTPGKLRVLRDKAGQTKADYLTEETYQMNGKSYTMNTAYALFTPTDQEAEYAICSPIVDGYGTIFFKNDSGHLMAFGSTIEMLEITNLPDKQDYLAGEAFDPTGMVVTATYTNGTTRDVTKYLTWDKTPLQESGELTLVFPYVKYRNAEKTGSTAMDSGVVTTKPTVTVSLTVSEASEGIHVVGDRVKIVFEEGQTVEDSWTVYAVSYSEHGKLLNVASATCSGTVAEAKLSGAANAHEVRVFVLKDDQTPAWERMSTLDKKEGT